MQEKEEAERQQQLEEFESGGRIDPIPNGLRVETKWLDDQYRTPRSVLFVPRKGVLLVLELLLIFHPFVCIDDSVVVKSRQIIVPKLQWLYYVHYPECTSRPVLRTRSLGRTALYCAALH
jgi:hypothetical protein